MDRLYILAAPKPDSQKGKGVTMPVRPCPTFVGSWDVSQRACLLACALMYWSAPAFCCRAMLPLLVLGHDRRRCWQLALLAAGAG